MSADVRRRGLGSPLDFRCPKCRSRVVKPTGKKRPYTPSAGHALGTRGNLEAAEYRCECGHVGWTNHNDVVREEHKMRGARVYFYDSDRPQGGKEIKESDLNASRFTGTKAQSDDGKSVGGIVIESAQGPRTVTRADFPEATGTVRAKLWMPGKEPEWYTLAEQGLVDVEVDAPNVSKFERAADPAMAGVDRAKRIENICEQLSKLGVPQEALDPILETIRPF